MPYSSQQNLRPATSRIGESAYIHYAASVDEELPAWDELPLATRNAWKIAAEAVRHQIEAVM